MEKVLLAAQLNKLARSKFCGVSFMRFKLNDKSGGAVLVPDTAVVLSMVVTKAYIDRWIIPVMTMDNLSRYVNLILKSIEIIAHRKEEAVVILRRF